MQNHMTKGLAAYRDAAPPLSYAREEVEEDFLEGGWPYYSISTGKPVGKSALVRTPRKWL